MAHINNYNPVAKFLHWSIALLIMTNYILGLTLDASSLYNLHEQIGLTILLLVVLRIIWRFTSKYPHKLQQVSETEQFAAVVGQILLYILMILIPIGGVLMTEAHGYPLSFLGVITIPTLIGEYPKSITHVMKEFHLWFAHALIFLAFGHAIIAIIHHYFLKDRLLRRMIPNMCNKNEN